MKTLTQENQFKNDSSELYLFIDNDYTLYQSQLKPILKNLYKKKEKGIYDSARAVDAFMYLANAGAKKYVKDMGISESWHTFFDTKCRRRCAEELTKSYAN